MVDPYTFSNARMPSSLTVLYTHSTAARGKGVAAFVDMVSVSDSDATVWLYVVPNGSTIAAGGAKMGGVPVRARGSAQWSGWAPLETTGDTIQGYALGGAVDGSVTGVLMR